MVDNLYLSFKSCRVGREVPAMCGQLFGVPSSPWPQSPRSHELALEPLKMRERGEGEEEQWPCSCPLPAHSGRL